MNRGGGGWESGFMVVLGRTSWLPNHRGVHWAVDPVEEPLPLQSKMAVQDATDGAIRCPMGSGKVLNAHLAVFGDGGGDGGD